MAGATHGWWCNSRTFPTTCKHCGEKVFYFSCDCGSKLFFDKLGYPWPQHRCGGFVQARTVSRLGATDLSGSMLSYLGIEDAKRISQLIDDSIEREYAVALQKAQSAKGEVKQQSSWTLRQDAYDGCETSETGRIVAVHHDADILKKAGIQAGAIGASRLGKFVEMPLVQMTIHTGALGEDPEDNCSFTFFVDALTVSRHRIARGSIAHVKLRGIVINSKYPIWICENLLDLSD